jgi:hypothetical protein
MAGQAEQAYEAMRRHNARLSVGVLALLRRQYDSSDLPNPSETASEPLDPERS